MYTLRPTADTVQENCFYSFAQVDPILFCGVLSLISSTLSAIHPTSLTVYKHLHYIFSLQPIRLSTRPAAWNISAPIGRISIKFDMWVFS